MDGVFLKQKLDKHWYNEVLNAEFVDLCIELEDGTVGYKIRLYPMKTIKEYLL
jgi:hypothetical protein